MDRKDRQKGERRRVEIRRVGVEIRVGGQERWVLERQDNRRDYSRRVYEYDGSVQAACLNEYKMI